jgi:hypothetical protein
MYVAAFQLDYQANTLHEDRVTRVLTFIKQMYETLEMGFPQRRAVFWVVQEFIVPYIQQIDNFGFVNGFYKRYIGPRIANRPGSSQLNIDLEPLNLAIQRYETGQNLPRPPPWTPNDLATSSSESNEAAVQRRRSSLASPPARSPITESPIATPAEFIGECITTFSDLPAPFTGLGNKLSKICNKLVNRGHCSLENIGRFYSGLHERYLYGRENRNESRRTFIVLTDVRRGDELKQLFQLLVKRTSAEVDEIFMKKVDSHSIRFAVREGAEVAPGPGPTRDFFQTVANQLFAPETGLFKPAGAGSGRMLLNHAADVSRLADRFANANTNRRKIFKIVGRLLAFLMLNGIKYDVHLSNYIQARMLYAEDEIRDDEILMHYLLDFPEDRVGRVALLKRPDDIAALGFDFNDEMELDPRRANEPLTAANYAAYTRLIARKKLEIAESAPYLTALLEGFYVTRRVLRNRGVTVQILDSLMTGREITPSEIDRVIASVLAFTQRAASWNSARGRERRQVLEWFFQILADRGELFPADLAATRPEKYAQTPDAFKRQLLFWWSASRYVSDTTVYKVLPEGGAGIYFRVHTCDSMIEFAPIIPSREEMYKNLLVQVAETEYTMY